MAKNKEGEKISKIYSNRKFYKKELLKIYEKYKYTIDEEMVELCDYINYNFNDMNTIFSCSGHNKKNRIGYLSIKYKNLEFLSKIIPLIPNNMLDFFVYIRNNESWFNISFKPKYFKEFLNMMFMIFKNHDKIMAMDTLPAFIIRNKKFISFDIDFFYWNEKQQGAKNG
jgi:hypothetical protein